MTSAALLIPGNMSPEEAQLGPAIIDLSALYMGSGMLDTLATDVRALLEFYKHSTTGESVSTKAKISKVFKKAIDQARNALRADVAAEFNEHLELLDIDSASPVSITELYVQVASVSRWLNLIHSRDNFLIADYIGKVKAHSAVMDATNEGQNVGFQPDIFPLKTAEKQSDSSSKRVGFQANETNPRHLG